MDRYTLRMVEINHLETKRCFYPISLKVDSLSKAFGPLYINFNIYTLYHITMKTVTVTNKICF